MVSLQLKEADSILAIEARSGTHHIFVPYLRNYNNFIRMFVSQDPQLYEEYAPARFDHFSEIEKLDESSPFKNWMLGNMHLQWALSKVMFGDYLSAVIEFNKAYRLIDKNMEEFPGFKPNELSAGVLNIIIGLVPEQYNWLLNLLSMRGDIQRGKEQLTYFLNLSEVNPEYAAFYEETLFFSGFVEMNIHPDTNKLAWIKEEASAIHDSVLLITFLRLNLLMRTGKNQDALVLFKEMEPFLNQAYPFHYLRYLNGECLQRAQKWQSSYNEFDYFTAHFMDENYIKDAWRKKAWAAFMLEDSAQYLKCMQEVKLRGDDRIDIDKEALASAENDQYPNKNLLLSRILFDGGYYSEVLDVLYAIDTSGYSDNDKLDYVYRTGRVYHEMNNFEKAKTYYGLALSLGKNSDSYYAANATLKLGELYESEGNISLAKEAYSNCMNLDFKQYKNSILRRAAEGLNRVSDQ
jgi:tetratricopeptide (TPR) repeat protein